METTLDLGYPWGRVRVPKGHILVEVFAACDAAEHEGHGACYPFWREALPPGALVVRGPVYVDRDWVALVAIPASPEAGGWVYAHIAGGALYGLLDLDDSPLLAGRNAPTGWNCDHCGTVLYMDYGEGMDNFVETKSGIWCLRCCGRLIWPRDA